jgi:hypothetical protein
MSETGRRLRRHRVEGALGGAAVEKEITAMSLTDTTKAVEAQRADRLLACCVVAGPLFLAVWAIQAFTREGFDPTYHPISLLSLGNLGWIQIANFVLTGGLYLAGAAGLRRVLRPGRGGTWGPILVGLNGIGLIIAGVFVADAGAGFPPGVPAGAPDRISWHGALHEVGFGLATLAWLAVCMVFLRRFLALKQTGWVVAAIAAPVAYLVVAAWPDLDSLSVRLVIASAISFGFLSALATSLLAPSVSVRA